MKSIVATIAALFAVTAMASTPAPKAEEKKPEVKPAAAAPAKEEKKCDPAKDKDCKPAAPAAKKEEKKAAEPAKK